LRGSKNVESTASQPPKARVQEMGSRSIARGREGAILPPPDCQTRAPKTCTILRRRLPTLSPTLSSVIGARNTSSPASRTSTRGLGGPISAAAARPAARPSPSSASFSRSGAASIAVTVPRRSQVKLAFTLTAICICPWASRPTESPAGNAVRLLRPLNARPLRHQLNPSCAFGTIGSDRAVSERADDPSGRTAPAVARVLRAAAGQAWERAFVSFACDEINGVFDRISAALAEGSPCPPALKARLLPILEALSWDREVAIRNAWKIAKGPFDRPEDAFAPALILSVLLPEDADVAAWVAARPPAVQQALSAARP
jgi:hypothetical protein